MVLNKKGFFFTILLLVLISLVLASSIFYIQTKERSSVQKRVQTMNDFIFSVEEDVQRNVYISGFRMIFLLEKRITETGAYISNPDQAFQEMFFNCTLSSMPQDPTVCTNFSSIERSLALKAEKLNVDLSMVNPSLSVSQDDPWHVKFALTTQFAMRDKSNLAAWNTTLTTVALVPIESFEDPIYLVNTNSQVAYTFTKTPYTVFAQGSNVANLTDHLNNHYYRASVSAPSFLDRLQGTLSADPHGVESLVYLPELSAHGISVETKSIIDYIYFSSSNPQHYGVTGMPSWFRLDDSSSQLQQYNVSSLTYP